MTTPARHILDSLNSYEGDNIYQDVIYAVEDFDATSLRFGVDGDGCDFLGEDGTHFNYSAQRGRWVAILDSGEEVW